MTFHDESPANDSNELPSAIVSPSSTSSYFILSTTSNGCSDEIAIEVSVNSVPETIINPSDTTRLCKNGSEVFTSNYLGGGIPPFFYHWSNGSNNQIIAVSANEIDSVETVWLEVTDSIGCTYRDSVFVETVESVTSAQISTSAVSNCGGNDGLIFITPLDGIPPFEISWNGPLNGTASNITGTFDIENLEQGAYSILINDSDPFDLGCQINIPIVIVNGPSATVDTNIVVSNVSCISSNDGGIDISVNGNNPTFLWSNGAMTEDISNVGAGFYSVTITDGICNNVITDIEVEAPDTFSYNYTTVDVSCYGFSDGSISIDVNGGTPPYTIGWDDGANGVLNENLTAGDYSFSLTDSNGCTFNSNTILVSQPSIIEIEIIETTDVSCFGGNDGSINISVSGGTGPYQFLWSNGATSPDINLLTQGNYQLTVTDENSCLALTPMIEISEPTSLLANLLNTIPPSCNGLSDGEIDIDIIGGTAPYQFIWSNNLQTEDIQNLTEGVYSVTISDFNNCETVLENIELVAPAVMNINLESTQDAFCEGISNGSIDISIQGGTQPYTFLWNNGPETEDIENLPAGEYQLVVSDFNNCTTESGIFIIENSIFVEAILDQENDINCFDDENGSVYLSTIGGQFPYAYNWNSGHQTEDIENLSPGSYFATIEDVNGCISHTDTFEITQPEPLLVEVISTESPNCNGFENGSIDVLVTGGTGSYIYSWNNGVTIEDLSNIPAGVYQLTVQDENDCVASSDVVFLTEPELIEIDVLNIVNVGCSGIEEGEIQIDVFGGEAPYEYVLEYW